MAVQPNPQRTSDLEFWSLTIAAIWIDTRNIDGAASYVPSNAAILPELRGAIIGGELRSYRENKSGPLEEIDRGAWEKIQLKWQAGVTLDLATGRPTNRTIRWVLAREIDHRRNGISVVVRREDVLRLWPLPQAIGVAGASAVNIRKQRKALSPAQRAESRANLLGRLSDYMRDPKTHDTTRDKLWERCQPCAVRDFDWAYAEAKKKSTSHESHNRTGPVSESS